MSNTKSNKIKNIFCSMILCFAMILSAFIGLNVAKTTVFADDSSNYKCVNVSSDLLNSYYNFYTSSSTRSTPATPNGWSEITGAGNQVNKDNILKGIVDLTDDTTFSSSTFKTSRPKNILENITSDNAYYKNLMINSHNGAGRFGYKSNSISLEANSYYSIAVRLYTNRTEKTDNYEETDAYASIYLTGLELDKDQENQVKFENINTLESWTDYTFYIDTFDSTSVNLELWLGSKTSNVQGAVFFNNVTIYRYSEDYYKEFIATKEDTDTDNHNIISFSKDFDRPVDNSSFETTTPLGWKNIAKSTTDSNTQICQIVDVNNYKLINDDVTISAPRSNNSAKNNHALFMYNKEEGYQAIESSEFTIEQLTYYKVSFFAKSDCNTGSGATVKLIDKTENSDLNATLTLSTSYTKNSNVYRNDWTQYSFYVYGDDLEDKQVALQIWMGTTDSKTSGYVFIDDFRMEKVSYQTFSNNSSSTNAKALNFNSDSDSFVVVNANFNKTNNEDATTTYPLAPSNWTKTGSTNNNTFSGVIKANAEHFDANKSNYTNTSITPTRPANHPIYGDNNNVLMIGSTSETNTQSYESDSISLSANSYYKLNFSVFTDYYKSNFNTNNGARFTLKTSSKTLFDYKNIYFNDETWHNYEIYIKTGNNSESANLYLSFENITGYVFFDDIRLETSKEEIFNNHTTYPDVIYGKVDLSYENFDNRTFNDYSKIQTPNNWTGAGQDSDTPTLSGIIAMDSEQLANYPMTPSNNKNVLMINSLHNVNYYYTSKENYSFTSKTYYKITVNVLTDNLLAENNPDGDDFGASITLNDSKDIIVKGIKTNGVWKTYTIYLSSEDALSSTITLGLGALDEKTSGLVLFDNLQVTSIDQDTFLNDLKTTDDDYTSCFINYTETEDTDEDTSTWTNEFNWLILPSLITAIAIIIAVVGFYTRKIKFNRKPKIKTKYDRRKTLDKDIDRRERIALRQQIIDELNAELESIDSEIEEFNKLAEQKLEELKSQIISEKEEIERKKLEIEIRKKEAKSEREKQLKANPELVSNAKEERQFEKLLSSLDKQEMSLQKQINQKQVKLENAKEADKSKLSKYLERKEFIKNEIAKIEAEIEEIAKEEAEMWEEYKRAKLEAKQRKAEYRAQQKAEKEAKKTTSPAKVDTAKDTKNKQVSNDKPVETKKTTTSKKKSQESKEGLKQDSKEEIKEDSENK